MTNRDHRSPGRWLLHTQQRAWAVNQALARGETPNEYAVQHLNLLNEVKSIFERQQALERSFSPELPTLRHRGTTGAAGAHTGGYTNPNLLVPINPDEVFRSGRGGYFSGEMRPQAGVRGEHAGAVPLYLGVPGMALPFLDLRGEDDKGKPFVSAPQGVPTPITEMTNFENQRYNVLENLKNGHSPYGDGVPIDDQMKVSLNAIIGAEINLAEQRGENIDHAEAAWRTVVRAHEDTFNRTYAAVDSIDFWDYVIGIVVGAVTGLVAGVMTGNPVIAVITTILGAISGGFGVDAMSGHSEDYKVAPTPASYGISEVPDDKFWENIGANEWYRENATPEQVRENVPGAGFQPEEAAPLYDDTIEEEAVA